MSDQFLAEIRIFAFDFAPRGWALCDGQLLPISQNTALFSLLGTTYGGDGKTTFALPNLQGSGPMHTTQFAGSTPFGQFDLGQSGGSETVTLLASAMPAHTHSANAGGTGTVHDPTGNIWASATIARQGQKLYAGAGNTSMHTSALSSVGGSLPHNNLMPYLVLNFCIALVGIFPPRP